VGEKFNTHWWRLEEPSAQVVASTSTKTNNTTVAYSLHRKRGNRFFCASIMKSEVRYRSSSSCSFLQRQGVAALLSICILPLVASQVTTVDNMPSLNSNDGVDFYYCESSFPYNVPQSIVYVVSKFVFALLNAYHDNQCSISNSYSIFAHLLLTILLQKSCGHRFYFVFNGGCWSWHLVSSCHLLWSEYNFA
jgi:hypothetical protein